MKDPRGFTLTELLVVIALIGILFAIALPVYQDYIKRATKTAAGVVLMDIVSRQQQYASTKSAFAVGDLGAGGMAALAELGVVVPGEVSASYEFEIILREWDSGTARMTGYEASAVPIAGGLMDGAPTLTVNQFGLRKPVGAW